MAQKKLSEFLAVPAAQAGIVVPVLVEGQNRTLPFADLLALLEAKFHAPGVSYRGEFGDAITGVNLYSIGGANSLLPNTTKASNPASTDSPGSVVEKAFTDGVTTLAYRFGVIENNQLVGFQVAYSSDKSFTFEIEVQQDSEAGYDYFFVTTDGTKNYGTSPGLDNCLFSSYNDNTLKKGTVTVPAGTGVLYFRYRKDSAGARGADTAYIRKLKINLPQFLVGLENGSIVKVGSAKYIYTGSTPTFDAPGTDPGWVQL